MNSHQQNGHTENRSIWAISRNELIGAGALILPSLLPGLSSGLQFFTPGIAACFLDPSGNFRLKLYWLTGIFVLGGLLLVVLGRPDGMLLLAQSVCLCAIIMLFTHFQRTAPETLLACSLCLAVLSVTIVYLGTEGRPLAAYQAIVKSMSAEFDKGVDLYVKNAGKDLAPELTQIMGQLKETMIAFFPAILGSMFIFLSLSNIYACAFCSRARKSRLVPGPDFQEWKMPPFLVWIFIISGFMAIYPGEDISSAGKNLVTAVSIFYLIQGFAVMKFFFQIMKIPVFVRWLVYLLIGIQWYGLLMVVFTGLMDNWFDFRQRLENSRKDIET